MTFISPFSFLVVIKNDLHKIKQLLNAGLNSLPQNDSFFFQIFYDLKKIIVEESML